MPRRSERAPLTPAEPSGVVSIPNLRRKLAISTDGQTSASRELGLGPRLRAARVGRRLSIGSVAAATGLTKGFISQLERDMTSPSVASLIKLCDALQISVGSLFDPPKSDLVRTDQKPRINFGGERVVEYLLTPSGNDRVQVIESYLEPGSGSGDETYSLNVDMEVVHVLAGSLDIVVQGDHHVLQAGDTLSFKGSEPHTWRNPSNREPAHVLWILTPPPW